MSHVVSSQPSSTSPYQPTEVQGTGNGQSPPRRSVTIETRQGHEDCCFRADKSQGCCIYYCCNFLASVCGGLRDCTDNLCNCCADCLNDCCEDKPKRKQRNVRYKFDRRGRGSYDYNDDNTWVVNAIHQDKGEDNDGGQIYRTIDESMIDQTGDSEDYDGGQRYRTIDKPIVHQTGDSVGTNGGQKYRTIDESITHQTSDSKDNNGRQTDPYLSRDESIVYHNDKVIVYQTGDPENHKSSKVETNNCDDDRRDRTTCHVSDYNSRHHSINHDSGIRNSSSYDSGARPHHTTSHDSDYNSRHNSNNHDSGIHHSSSHDSGAHHTSSHDTGTHHTSSHDTGTHHTSSHDTGGHHDSSTYDSGGGGDCGGGCDSGGGDTSYD